MKTNDTEIRKTPTAKPSTVADIATETAVSSGKHAMISAAVLAVAWSISMIYEHHVLDALMMAGVLAILAVVGQVLIVVGHAAQLAEDERQRLRDIDVDAAADSLALRIQHERENSRRQQHSEHVRRLQAGLDAGRRPAPNPTRPEARRL